MDWENYYDSGCTFEYFNLFNHKKNHQDRNLMKLKEIYFLLINSKDLWKKISTTSISFVLLLSIALIKDAFKEPDILVNKKGEAVAIQRKNLDKIY